MNAFFYEKFVQFLSVSISCGLTYPARFCFSAPLDLVSFLRDNPARFCFSALMLFPTSALFSPLSVSLSALCLSYLYPRIFALRRLWSYSKRAFLSALRFSSALCLSFAIPRVLLYGAFGLIASALFSPLSVSLSALCLSFAIIPPRFCFSALMLFPTCALFSPLSVSFSASCLSYLYPRIFALWRLWSYNKRAFLYRPAPRIVFPLFPHTVGMKLTTHVCCFLLIFFGLCAAVYALTGFPLLYFLCFSNTVAFRAVLSLGGIAAGWLLFWLIAFRPTAQLS